MSGLRSDGWLSGDDEVAMAHRVALRSSGLTVGRGGRPVVGIANSWSDLNPCNLPLRALAGAVRDGIEDAGGIPAEFGTISLGEDLMKPTAMLYRNLLAIEIEEMIRSYPLDGIVILANCDKSVPGAIMGAASAGVPAAPGAAREAGRCAVASVGKDLRPSVVLSPAAFGNAIRVLHAAGGSTNAVIHLAAIAGRVGVPLPLDDIGRLGAGVPVLADVQPSGTGLIQDFHAAGGLPALLAELAPLLDPSPVTVTGASTGEIVAAAPAPAPGGAIRRRHDPLRTGGAFAVVRGSLAPQGAVIKVSAASPELLEHRGPAVVFRGYDDMRTRVDDPGLPVTSDSVLILTGCGPVGVPGMPEWGMIPIPAKLAAAGVRDMVRVTDARMSGTSFGTVFLHVAPEAAVGGPLALVRDGDMISVDAATGLLDLDVGADELAWRRAAWSA